ncbi:zinc finger, c2H2 type domain-containing protein [Cordyceps javanica]|nr:zinc finger, c2H2 type domain-containing protein [Cordyceps javanica]
MNTHDTQPIGTSNQLQSWGHSLGDTAIPHTRSNVGSTAWATNSLPEQLSSVAEYSASTYGIAPACNQTKAESSTAHQEGSFKCDVEGCGKLFTRSYNYKAHLETHDQRRQYPFHCHVHGCDKKFARKTDLQRHHQSVHMKERNHGCTFCGRFFARKDTLHMEDGCPKRFDIETIDLDHTHH